MKHYLVNTPLILQDENGEDVRVERGEIIELSDTQYAEVAAHVTFAEFHGGVSKEEMAHLIDGQPENPQENQAETQMRSEQTSETSANSEQAQSENPQDNQTETPAETTDKPKRGQSKAKDAE